MEDPTRISDGKEFSGERRQAAEEFATFPQSEEMKYPNRDQFANLPIRQGDVLVSIVDLNNPGGLCFTRPETIDAFRDSHGSPNTQHINEALQVAPHIDHDNYRFVCEYFEATADVPIELVRQGFVREHNNYNPFHRRMPDGRPPWQIVVKPAELRSLRSFKTEEGVNPGYSAPIQKMVEKWRRDAKEKQLNKAKSSIFKDDKGSVTLGVALLGVPALGRALGKLRSQRQSQGDRVDSVASRVQSDQGRSTFLSKLGERFGKVEKDQSRNELAKQKPKKHYFAPARQKIEAYRDLQRLRASSSIKLDAVSRRDAKEAAQKLTKTDSKVAQQDQMRAASPPPPKRRPRLALPDNRSQNKQVFKQADVRPDKVRHAAQPASTNTHPISSKPTNNPELNKGATQTSPAGDKKQNQNVKQQPSQAPKPASPNQVTSNKKLQPPVQPAAASADKKTEQPKQPAASAPVPAPSSKVTAKPTEQTPSAAQAKQNSTSVANTTKPAEAAKPSSPVATTQSQTNTVVATEGPKPAPAATTPQQKSASPGPTPKTTETPKTVQNLTTANEPKKGPTQTAPNQASATTQPSPTSSKQATATPKATAPTQKTEQAPVATKTATASPSPSASPSVATAGPKPAPTAPPPNQAKAPPAQQKVAAAPPPRNVSPPPPRPRRIPPPPPPPPPRRSR